MTTLEELKKSIEAASRGHGATSHWDYVYRRLDALEAAVIALIAALQEQSQ